MISNDDATRPFMWSVMALAQSAAAQRDLYPSFVEVADELALDFEEGYRVLIPIATRFKPEEVQYIEELDVALGAMSGPGHDELWTLEALEHSPEWEHIRCLARQVLRVMGWPGGPPPRERATYVGSDA